MVGSVLSAELCVGSKSCNAFRFRVRLDVVERPYGDGPFLEVSQEEASRYDAMDYLNKHASRHG